MTTLSGETLRTPSSLPTQVGIWALFLEGPPEYLAANTSSPQAAAPVALCRVGE